MDMSRLADARIRPARTEEDLARAREFLQTSRLEEIVEGHPDERGCVRLCELDGHIAGALLLDPNPIRLRGIAVRCARLVDTGCEDGRPYYRRTGDPELFELLTEEFLGYLWARRYPLAYAHGELALFPALGFTPCFFHPRVSMPVADALKLPAPYRVRHLKRSDLNRVAALRRRDERWRPVVYASAVPMFHHFCVEGPEREIKGYFSLEINAKAKWAPAFFAPEVEVADRAAAMSVLNHCAHKAHAEGIDAVHFPVGLGHTMANACLDLGGSFQMKGAATDPLLSEEMLHIVDAVRLIDALAPALERNLAGAGVQGLRASIPLATEKGSWFLKVEGGKVSLEPCRQPVEDSLFVPHWAFTQFLAGYRGATELGVETDEQTQRILRLLFPRTWPYSLPDPDHWETLPPPDPYAPEVKEKVVRMEMPWARPW